MSGFDQLLEESNFFVNELRRTSGSLTVVTDEKLIDDLSKKMRDVRLYAAKLKLLQAVPLSLHSQISEIDENVMKEYGETVESKLIENMTVRSVTQAHAVKELITTPDEKLDTALKNSKQELINTILEYHKKESQLCHLNRIMKEREDEHANLRAQWDKTLGTLKDLQDQRTANDDGDRGPLYERLSKFVRRLELMRWLIGRLVCSSSHHYDWVMDPQRLITLLPLTREHNTIDMFTK